MTRSDSAATDILSSLPIIACCIVSVMILVGVLAHTTSGGSIVSKGGALDEECHRILSTTLKVLTSESEDGRRFIAHDWEVRLRSMEFHPEDGPDVSLSIEVRLFRLAPFEIAVAGSISSCQEVRSAAEPVILVDQGRLVPGEIIVKVGS
jgi:hypothetical protein